MFRVAGGSTHGLADTARFVELLNDARGGQAANKFFDSAGELIVTRAPGRLDLMGGIADYSGSLVLELPIANATHVALQLCEDKALRVLSLAAGGGEAPRRFEMSLDDFSVAGQPIPYGEAARLFSREPKQHWAAYVAGAFIVLMREKNCAFKQGARILVHSDVPEGKGVSSSAALEVASMRAVAEAYGVALSPHELALLCQKVENFVAGAPCGVMDQMTSARGEQDKLLALLCQPAEIKGLVELPSELGVWGIDSGIRHSVGGADYGTVRTAAFMGYRIIADAAGLPWRESGEHGRVAVDDHLWGGYLANVMPAEFAEEYAALLPERMPGAEFLARYKGITDEVTCVKPERMYPVMNATRHPVFEHARVERFAQLLAGWRGFDAAEELGELMYASHESYTACGLGSAGTDELVRLVMEAGPAAGLYGAKITGGGAGGTVAVLGRRDAGGTIEAIAHEYASRSGLRPLIISGSSPGACAFGALKLIGGN